MALTSKAEWRSGVGIAGSGTTLTWTDQIGGFVLQRTFGTPSYASGVVSLPAGAGMRMPTSPLMSTSGTPLIIGVRLKVVTFTQYMRLFYLGNGSTYNDANYVGISLDQASSTSWTVSFGPVTRTVSSYVGSYINVIQVLNGASSQLYFGTTQQGANFNNTATSMGNRFQLKDLADLNYASVGSVDYYCARIATATSIAADVAEMDSWLTSGGNTSDVTVSLTGISSTSGLGSLAIGNSHGLAGSSATGSIGTISETLSASLGGFSAAGATGLLGQDRSLTAAGQAATGQIGTTSYAASVGMSGNEGTSGVGTFSDTISAPLVGQAGAGQIGTITASATSDITVTLTGVGASSGIGNISYAVSNALAGTPAAGEIGSVVSAIAIALAGREATGQIGALTVSTSATNALIGVPATGQIGSITAAIAKALTGTSASGQIGAISEAVALALTGVSATGQIGTLTPSQSGGTITVGLSGVESLGQIGQLGVQGADALFDTHDALDKPKKPRKYDQHSKERERRKQALEAALNAIAGEPEIAVAEVVAATPSVKATINTFRLESKFDISSIVSDLYAYTALLQAAREVIRAREEADDEEALLLLL